MTAKWEVIRTVEEFWLAQGVDPARSRYGLYPRVIPRQWGSIIGYTGCGRPVESRAVGQPRADADSQINGFAQISARAT